MHISLIGMSGTGKTHLGKRFETINYEVIECDPLVEAKLGQQLTKQGFAGIEGVAEWMGQPYAQQYAQTSAAFSRCEGDVMQEVAGRLQQTQTPLIIDTTGSVIYINRDTTDALKQTSHIIYLEASPAHKDALLKAYAENPKPVIWPQSIFYRNPDETDKDALIRCFPDLLKSRDILYRQLAHTIIPWEEHRDPNFNLGTLVDLANSSSTTKATVSGATL